MNKTTNFIKFNTILVLATVSGFATNLSTDSVYAKSEAPKTKPATTKIVEKKKANKSPRKSVGLVPPPPPTIPRVLPGDSLSIGSGLGLSAGIDYLSEEDLKFKLKTLQKNLEGLSLDLKDSTQRLEESVKRSSNFDGLFEEGVVSRKELESAKRETRRLKRSVEREELKVEEVKRVVAKVEARLAEMEKSKVKKTNSKKSTAKKKRRK